ncbi:hypothetical protein OQA88_8713 [Cercophora sp. LCS_1]
MSRPTYQYQPIDLGTDAIRLVSLRKGCFEDPVECHLFQTWLHQIDGVPYDALSYHWGGTDKAAELILDECTIHITENLYTALQHLRYEDRDRILWIDAISIDQENKKEQGHQVGQMKSVYTNAEQVVIWLGSSTNDIDLLMDIMHRMHEDAGAVWPIVVRQLQDVDFEMRTRLRVGLDDLLSRPWFKKVWIIQEVATARGASVMCGRKSVSTKTFTEVPSILGVVPGGNAQAILDVMPGRARKQSWWSDKRDLGTLLSKFRNSEATDPRDNVYALLGISSDACDIDVFRPDYEIPLGQVIQYTIAFLLWGEAVNLSIHRLPEWKLSQLVALSSRGNLGRTVLDWALIQGHEATSIRIMFSEPGMIVGMQNCLLAMAEHGASKAVLDSFAACERIQVQGSEVIRIAERKGHIDVVQAFLRRVHDKRYMVLNEFVAAARRYNLAGALKPPVTFGRVDLDTLLDNAIRRQHYRMASFLHCHGATPSSSVTAYHLRKTVIWDNYEMAQFLLDCGTHVDSLCDMGVGLDIKDLSLETRRYAVNAKSRIFIGRMTSLAMAANRGRERFVRLFLSHGASVHVRDENGRTPLSHAAGNASLPAHRDIVQRLLDAGSEVDSRDYQGRTPLSRLIGKLRNPDPEIDIDIARLLLQHGADPDAKDNGGETPRSWAGKRDKNSVFSKASFKAPQDTAAANLMISGYRDDT